MKLTDDIVRALHSCIEDGFHSVADFARFANVSANTISKYIRKETSTIQKDTWQKLHPLIRSYLPKGGGIKHETALNVDQKILLDAFDALPDDVRNQKLLEIVELAKLHLRQTESGNQKP